MSDSLSDRDLRQRDIIPPERLAECRATVVGVGAIGRQVALQLAAMGIPWLQLVDHDTVEAVNLGCQGYRQGDLGRAKVTATAELCQELNHALAVDEVPERFRRSMEIGNVLFCCVDQIDTRRLIFEAVKDRIEFFCDGRMAAEVVRVLAVCDTASREYYPTTLFAPDEAFQGTCTSKSTIFSANIGAGLMLSQFSKWLRRMPVDRDATFNVLALESVCA